METTIIAIEGLIIFKIPKKELTILLYYENTILFSRCPRHAPDFFQAMTRPQIFAIGSLDVATKMD